MSMEQIEEVYFHLTPKISNFRLFDRKLGEFDSFLPIYCWFNPAISRYSFLVYIADLVTQRKRDNVRQYDAFSLFNRLFAPGLIMDNYNRYNR